MTYDPRRSRPTPKAVPDEDAAPIDALLGPSPEPEPEAAPAVADSAPEATPAVADSAPASPSAVPRAAEVPPQAASESAEAPEVEPTPAERPSPTSLPTPVRKAERAPSPVLQLAPLLIAAVVALVWLIRRRR